MAEKRNVMVLPFAHLVGCALDHRALELPRREAVEMEVVLVQSGEKPISLESDGDLGLVSGHGLTADDTGDSHSGTAPQPVWLS